MTFSMRFAVLSLLIVSGCSLATDFDRFRVADQKGGTLDGGGDGSDAGQGDGDAASGDGGPKVEGQIDVQLAEDALGSVTAMPAGIDCPGTCSFVYATGTEVVLTANPDATAAFVGWGGACQGQAGLTCTLTAGTPQTVTATFTSDWFDVTVSRLGGGMGSVSSSDDMIRCDGQADEVCLVRYPRGVTVDLVATPLDGASSFSGWGGSCAGEGACQLQMFGNKLVNAVFDTAGQVSLIVSKEDNGSGTVQSNDGTAEQTSSIMCGAVCAATFALGDNTPITLTAEPDASSSFEGFTGDCLPSSAPGECNVTMDAVKRVTAKFKLKTRVLDIAWAGLGDGAVDFLQPDQAACVKPNACNSSHNHGTMIRLEAQAAEGSTFKQWSVAACGTALFCEFSLLSDTLVLASFDLKSYSFTAGPVGPEGPTGAQNGLLCTVHDDEGKPVTGACAATYPHGTEVIVTAAPALHNVLASWGQACAGQPANQPCSLTITSDTSVLGTFERQKHPLNVTFETVGDGVSGSVAEPSIELACASGGAPCTAQVPYGTELAIAATAGPGNELLAFTGCDSVTGSTCNVTVDGAEAISVTFKSMASDLRTLLVYKSGGLGTVTSVNASDVPTGQIDCGGDCSEGLAAGSPFKLKTVADPGYQFVNYTGAPCGGSGNICDGIMMPADKTEITANLQPANFAVSVSIPGPALSLGKVTATALVGGVQQQVLNCGKGSSTCSVNRPFGSTVTLVMDPGEHSVPSWTSGPCVGKPTDGCTITVGLAGQNAVGADFVPKRYRVAINLDGTGVGGTSAIVNGPGALACTSLGVGCVDTFDALTAIQLNAVSPPWAKLVSFGEQCKPAVGNPNVCNITSLTGNTTVDVFFDAKGALAFITSGASTGDLQEDFGPPLGARAGDKTCQQLAGSAHLPGEWLAWLSDDIGGPAKRFRQLAPSTPVVRLDGEFFMPLGFERVNKDGGIEHPLVITDKGASLLAHQVPPYSPIPVWTGTHPNGLPIEADAVWCKNWSSTAQFIEVGVGNAVATDWLFTTRPPPGIIPPKPISCSSSARLYCIQDAEWPPPPPF